MKKSNVLYLLPITNFFLNKDEFHYLQFFKWHFINPQNKMSSLNPSDPDHEVHGELTLLESISFSFRTNSFRHQ